jgi:ATP-dependent Clp protease ATP-binding subunit ClpC
MPDLAVSLLIAFLAGGLGYTVATLLGRGAGAPTPGASFPPGVSVPDDPAVTSDIRKIASDLLPHYNNSAYAADLLDEPTFQRGVELLCDESNAVETLLGYYTGDSALLATMALEALARREGDPDVRPQIVAGINDYVPWTRFFALRALDALTPQGQAIAGRVLSRIDSTWNVPINVRILREFLEQRSGKGEKLAFGTEVEELDDESADDLLTLFDRMPAALVDGLREELTRWRSTRIDHSMLESIGQVWRSGPPSPSLILSHASLDKQVARVESLVARRPPRSVLLVGEHGVGKTAIVHSVARRLAADGWVVWEAGHNELIAGMVYIGQIEERLRDLLQKLSKRRVLWLVNEFHALALSGRHKYGPMSVLDYLIPQLEVGNLVLLGETRPRAFERLVQTKPRVLTAMETVRVDPLPEAETMRLVDRWADSRGTDPSRPALTAETRREAWLLAEQYLGDRAAPGHVLSLCEVTRQRCAAADPEGGVDIGVDDLITTLGQMTGLPAAVLDERQGLDLGGLREHFEARVMGQPEAIDCLVERVAMIKAGVTDPTRPFGVFLFAGPTGTGKTEIAKSLAAFLFGSPERMVRLDMSEFKDPESIQRLLGREGPESDSEALVDSIRQQPFSVVLLDEFEKAHPNIWDLFLQVFDDGRLTDRSGNTADFRNAIIILTSNLGSRIASGASLGFNDQSGRFSEVTVRREIHSAFRPEFLNRLDRVVVFRPLGRDTMRAILRKDLADAFQRRGLRNRAWAVEWDETALEFLLERGFTADLGARPLKRAIERHVLVPLAKTIVEHRYPEGDQFLFVRADGDRLVAQFVDPDAPEAGAETAEEVATGADERLSLGRISLEARGRPDEMEVLRATHRRLSLTVQDDVWQRDKRTGLERIADPAFWRSDSRFETLGRIEYLDRIEAGVKSAGSLLERLAGYEGSPRSRYPRDLVGRLASQLFLLRAACHDVQSGSPREAFLQVEAWSDAGTPSRTADDFARRVGAMYRSWADRRRMQCEVLDEHTGPEPYQLLLAVSGYAAHSILAGESGLHVLETPTEGSRKVRKVAARVHVVAQPETPPPGRNGARRQARQTLAAHRVDQLAIVRRYREHPSPLVRDVARGWRTGRLDLVLGGDFDLFAPEP